MTDLEISKALALAIGWPKMNEYCGILLVAEYGAWRPFDYRDWNVIGPIAERYDCFPYHTYGCKWTAWSGDCSEHDTPQKAIAMAVIGAKT